MTIPVLRGETDKQNSYTCWKCGLLGHSATHCKTKNMYCNKCNSDTHNTKVCKSRRNKETPIVDNDTEEEAKKVVGRKKPQEPKKDAKPTKKKKN